MARPRKNSEHDILVATDDGVVHVDGQDVPFTRGVTRFRRSHPAVKQCPNLFEPINVHYDVEQTTAAPGEKRGDK